MIIQWIRTWKQRELVNKLATRIIGTSYQIVTLYVTNGTELPWRITAGLRQLSIELSKLTPQSRKHLEVQVFHRQSIVGADRLTRNIALDLMHPDWIESLLAQPRGCCLSYAVGAGNIHDIGELLCRLADPELFK